MNLPSTLILFSVVIFVAGLTLASRADDEGHGGARHGVQTACLSATDREAIARDIALAPLRYRVPRGPDTLLEQYAFFPQAGAFWGDLAISNYVDLDASSGIRDSWNGMWSYNGHRGIDCAIYGFTMQDLGIPVFAVLDGTVVSAHDGEADRNTFWGNQPANYVVISHNASHITQYYHLRKNSVSVAPGQPVKAGQQIGLTGSSGISDGPHLHFGTQLDGQTAEPFTGPGRPSRSLWQAQPPHPAAPYVQYIMFADTDLSAWNPSNGTTLDAPRRSWFQTGSRTAYLTVRIANGPSPGATHRFQFIRPDGSIAYDNGTAGFGGSYHYSWWWWSRTVNFNVAGTWRLAFHLNGALSAEAPFDVVASAAPPAKRAPKPLSWRFDPGQISASGVPVVRTIGYDPVPDADFDPVSYRYQWTVNGGGVRDVTTGARGDVLQRGLAFPGDAIQVSIIPSDSTHTGGTTVLSATVYEPYETWAARLGLPAESFTADTDGDGLSNGLEFRLGRNPKFEDGELRLIRNAGTGDIELTAATPAQFADPQVILEARTTTDFIQWQPAEVLAPGRWRIGEAGGRRGFVQLRASRGPLTAATVLVREILPP